MFTVMKPARRLKTLYALLAVGILAAVKVRLRPSLSAGRGEGEPTP